MPLRDPFSPCCRRATRRHHDAVRFRRHDRQEPSTRRRQDRGGGLVPCQRARAPRLRWERVGMGRGRLASKLSGRTRSAQPAAAGTNPAAATTPSASELPERCDVRCQGQTHVLGAPVRGCGRTIAVDRAGQEAEREDDGDQAAMRGSSAIDRSIRRSRSWASRIAPIPSCKTVVRVVIERLLGKPTGVRLAPLLAPCALQEHDADAIIFGCLLEQSGQPRVHACRHRAFFPADSIESAKCYYRHLQ